MPGLVKLRMRLCGVEWSLHGGVMVADMWLWHVTLTAANTLLLHVSVMGADMWLFMCHSCYGCRYMTVTRYSGGSKYVNVIVAGADTWPLLVSVADVDTNTWILLIILADTETWPLRVSVVSIDTWPLRAQKRIVCENYVNGRIDAEFTKRA